MTTKTKKYEWFEDEALDAVAALIKATIGESKLFVRGYSLDWEHHAGHGHPRVVVEVEGDVTGKLTLSGHAARRAQRLIGTEAQAIALRNARAEIELLKARIARLHELSDPNEEND